VVVFVVHTWPEPDEIGENVGHVLEPRPVELQVLPGREVTVSAVVGSTDASKHPQLVRREQPVRNRHAQHRRVLLNVQSVLQPQRAEIVLGQLPLQEAPRPHATGGIRGG